MNFKRFYKEEFLLQEAADTNMRVHWNRDEFNTGSNKQGKLISTKDIEMRAKDHKVKNALVQILSNEVIENTSFENCVIKRGKFKGCTFNKCLIWYTEGSSFEFDKNITWSSRNYLVFHNKNDDTMKKFEEMLVQEEKPYLNVNYVITGENQYTIMGICTRELNFSPFDIVSQFRVYMEKGQVKIRKDIPETEDEKKLYPSSGLATKYKSEAKRLAAVKFLHLYNNESAEDKGEFDKLTDISNSIIVGMTYKAGGRLESCICINCKLQEGSITNSFIIPPEDELGIGEGSFKLEDNCWIRARTLDKFKNEKEFIDYLSFNRIITDATFDFNPLTEAQIGENADDGLEEKINAIANKDITGFFVKVDKVHKFMSMAEDFQYSEQANAKYNVDGKVWKNGVCANGILENIVWKDGFFKNGKLINSEWQNGIFFNGVMEKCKVERGSFEGGVLINCRFDGGTFDATKKIIWIQTEFDNPKVGWHGGVWKGGFIYDPNKDGNIDIKNPPVHDINWSNGTIDGVAPKTPIKFTDFAQYNGVYVYSIKTPEEYWKNTRIKESDLKKKSVGVKNWKGGSFKGGVLLNTNFESGIIENGLILNSIIKNAEFKNGIFVSGTIDGADVKNIVWIDGEWKSGTWNKNGQTWIYDPHLEGNIETIERTIDIKNLEKYLKDGKELEKLRTQYNIKDMLTFKSLANDLIRGTKKIQDIPANVSTIFKKISGNREDTIAWKVTDIGKLFDAYIKQIESNKDQVEKGKLSRTLEILKEYRRDIIGNCVLSPIDPAEYWKGINRPKERKSLFGRLMAIAKTQLPDLTAGAGENIQNIQKQVQTAMNIWRNKKIEPEQPKVQNSEDNKK